MASQHEEAFIAAFITSRFKERWLSLCRKRKRRNEFLSNLHGTGNALDQRFAQPIPGNWSSTDIARRLRELGANNECFLFSSDPSLDGQLLSLDDATSAMLGHQMGTVASCIPGRLAYWEAEGPNDRVICHRED